MRIFIFIAALLLAGNLRAQVPEEEWRVVFQPSHMRPEVAIEIPNSRSTVMSPARFAARELIALTREEWDALDVDWPEFLEHSVGNSQKLLEDIAPEEIRNDRGVLTALVYRSAYSTTQMLPLLPDFRKRIEEKLGPEILVAIPSRQMVIAWPKQGSEPEELAALVLQTFKNSPWAASTELFEVTDDGLRAVGNFEPEE